MNKNMYHRYLTLPFEHSMPKCYNTEHNDVDYHVQFVQKEWWDLRFVEWLKKYQLKPSNVSEGFYVRPNGGGLPIHNDSAVLSNIVNINFTWGPLTSTTRWWQLKNGSSFEIELPENTHITEQKIKPDVNIKQYLRAREEECDLMYEQVIHTPSLMNVGQLHNTNNPDTKMGRWTLSYIILKSDNTHLQFEEALKIFKDVAYE